MQKPNSQDLLRAAGWSIGTAGLLFSMALTAKIPLQQLLTPMAIGIMLAVGVAVSVVDLVIVLGNPKRLAIARGEKMPSPEDIQKFQWQASNILNAIIFRQAVIIGLVLVGLVVLVIFWR